MAQNNIVLNKITVQDIVANMVNYELPDLILLQTVVEGAINRERTRKRALRASGFPRTDSGPTSPAMQSGRPAQNPPKRSSKKSKKSKKTSEKSAKQTEVPKKGQSGTDKSEKSDEPATKSFFVLDNGEPVLDCISLSQFIKDEYGSAGMKTIDLISRIGAKLKRAINTGSDMSKGEMDLLDAAIDTKCNYIVEYTKKIRTLKGCSSAKPSVTGLRVAENLGLLRAELRSFRERLEKGSQTIPTTVQSAEPRKRAQDPESSASTMEQSSKVQHMDSQ